MEKSRSGNNWSWIGTVVLVGVSMGAGAVLSQMWEPVHGQPVHGQSVHGQPAGFYVENPPVAPQVVVQQPAELPKWFVDFAPISPQIRAITVVDTEAKKIAVYHLDVTDGGLRWLSTRNIQPDLMVDQHNPRLPLPSDLMQEMQRLEVQRLGQIRQSRF